MSEIPVCGWYKTVLAFKWSVKEVKMAENCNSGKQTTIYEKLVHDCCTKSSAKMYTNLFCFVGLKEINLFKKRLQYNHCFIWKLLAFEGLSSMDDIHVSNVLGTHSYQTTDSLFSCLPIFNLCLDTSWAYPLYLLQTWLKEKWGRLKS